MTSTNDSTSLYSKMKRLATPAIDPTEPIHVTFLANQMKRIHGTLESRLYYYLNPKNAAFCTTLLYAIPTSLIINALSITHTATLSLMGGGFLLTCKEELVSRQSKITILQSLAIGFFANLCKHSEGFSENGLLKLSLNMTFLAASLLAANLLEKADATLPEENAEVPFVDEQELETEIV